MVRKTMIKRAISCAPVLPYNIITLYSQQSQHFNNSLSTITTTLKMPSIEENISRLQVTAKQASSAVLTNNQVGKLSRMFVISKQVAMGTPMHWIHDTYQSEQYQCYINARICKARGKIVVAEESVSFPFFHAEVNRFREIEVSYLDRTGKQVIEVLEGNPAFAFQHCWDFTIGRHILDWRLHHGRLTLQEEVRQKLPKTNSVVEQYTRQLAQVFSRYPKLCELPEKLEEHEIKWLYERGSQQAISIEEDYLSRIHKHYRKQMFLLLERLEHNIS